MATSAGHRGIEFGPGVGKFLFRVRQTHIAGHYSPLIARGAAGAVKMDLLLRAIGLSPEHAGAREPGFVLWDWHYEHLHDLIKATPSRTANRDRTDRATRHLKRKWVKDQLDKLADLRLVKLEPRAGERSKIVVLRDDGSEDPFDDPGAPGGYTDNRYVTIRGSVIASGAIVGWGAPELAAYLAAIYAEFHRERGADRNATGDGSGDWWRQLAWFSNPHLHPLGRTVLPFSKSLLEDGLKAHVATGLVTRQKIKRPPGSGQPFDTERVLYHNRFFALDSKVTRRLTAEQYAQWLDDLQASSDTAVA